MAINNFNAKNGLSVGSNPINIVDNTANATFATAMTTGSMGVGTPVVATSRLFVSGTSTATDTTLVVRAGVPSPSGRLLDIRNNAGTSVASVDYLGNIFGVSGSFSGDITITGNLTVAGTQTIVNSEVVNIKDNIVLLNANPVPAATGGIYVADTTTNTTGSLIWDSAADLWKAGKVGSEVALVSGSGTNNYVVKWNGSNALGTSVVYDDGTNVGIGTSLLDSKFVVAGNVVVSGSVNPSADNNSNYVIGTAAKRWSNVVSNAFSGSLTKLSDGVTNYLQAGANIVITTGSNGSVSVTTTGLAPSSAQYLTLTADSSLTSERIFSPGVGLKATDGGAGNNYTLSINDGIVATVSGTTFTGVTNHNAGLSGSLTRLTNGTSYLIAGNNMQITTGSTGAVTISSTATGATYVAGTDTQVQFNDGGTFGADADFIFDKTNNLLKVTNISGSITSSNVSAGQVVLAGSGGVLSGSNNLFWVNSNSNLVVGAGTTSADPANRLQLSDNQTNLRGMEFRPGSINYIISYNRGTPGYLPFHLGASTFKFSDGSYTNFIDSVGNVGVGMSSAVTSVSSKLLVSGSATASTPTTTIREGVVSPTDGVGILDVQNSAGASVLFVSGSGRVGVGTNVLSTSNKFEVYQGRLAVSGYSSELYLDGSNSGYSTITSFGAGNYKDLWLRTVSGTTDGIWIKSLTGNVGIGTSTISNTKLLVYTTQYDAAITPTAIDINGAWIRLGDPITNAGTFNNGMGIKFYDGGNVHYSAGVLSGSFYISQTSDNGSILYSPARTDGFVMNSSGQVGIGNTSPTATLHVGSNDAATLLINGGSKILIRDSNSYIQEISGLQIESGTGRSLHLRTAGSQRLSIDTSGNVGIGTSLLDSRFVVNGNVVVSGSVNPDLDATRDLGTSTKRWRNLYATNISGSLTGSNVSEGQVIVAGVGGVLSGSNNFWWSNSNNSVGIGTNNPATVLHVKGSSTYAEGAISLTPNTGGRTWQILSQQASSILRIYDSSFGENRMLFDSNGNVGVGSTTALSAKFQVSGSSTATTPTMIVKEGVVSPTGGALLFDAQNSTGTSVLLVSGSGNVGINMSPTSFPLGVFRGATTTPQISAVGTSGVSGVAGYNLRIDSTDLWQLITDNNASNGFYVQYNTGTSARYLAISTGGNVGIGSTQPGSKLTVAGNIEAVGYSVYAALFGGGSLATLQGSTSAVVNTTGASSNVLLQTANTERVRIDPSGNVGIGTNNANGNRVAISGGNLSVTGSVLPGVTTTYDLGSTTYRWRDMYARSGSFSGDVTVTGDLFVNGTQFIVNTQVVEIEDNAILLNAGPSPAATGGIYVADTTTNVTGSLLWDTTTDQWKAGKLGSEVTLVSGSGTNNYVTKWNGSNALGTSVIFDNGTNVGVGTNSPANRFHIFGSSNDTVSRANANLTIEGAGGNGLVIGTYSSAMFPTYIQSGYVSNFGTATYPLSLNPLGGSVGIGTTATGDKLAVNGSMSITGSLLPGSDNTYTLGNSSKRWSNTVSNAFSGSLTKLSDGTTNYLQAGPNITLTTGSNGAVTIEATMAAGTISGGGAVNYITKFTGTNSVGNSIIYDNGTNVGIGTTVTSDKLAVNGSMSVTGSLLPGVDNLYDLGSASKRWRSIQAVSISGSLTGSNVLANQVVVGGTGGVLSGTNYFTYDGNLNISGSLRSLFSAGDEGGELFFLKPQTNSTLTTGVTIDLWRNRIRIFETEGTNRGGYFDISALAAGVGTNLTPLPGGSDTQVQFNDGGAFGGSSGLTYNKTTGALTGTYVVAATGFSGSLTRLTNGTSYIIAGGNMSVISGTNGAITLATVNSGTIHGVTAGNGLLGGGTSATVTLTIDNGIVATVSGTTFTGVTNHNAGLSGSLTKLTNGTSYLIAGNNVQITTGSTGAVTIASTATGATYVAGFNTQVQFNDGGTFGADADFVFDKTSNLLKVTNISGSLTGSNVTVGQVVVTAPGGVLSGSNKLFWDNSNSRLGIGTSALSYDLVVGDNGGLFNRNIFIQDSGYGLLLSAGSGVSKVQSRGMSMPLEFQAGNTNDGNYWFTSTGKVGIGTTTGIVARLTVTGSTTTTVPTLVLREAQAMANNVALADFQNSSGTSLFFVSGSGNVGIGTNIPATKLEVSNGSVRLGDGYSVQWVNSNNYIFGNSSNVLALGTNGSSRLVIDSSGNVGVGTAAMDSRLVVNGNSVFSGSANPDADNTRDLGSATKRWANVYANNVTSSGSLGPAYTTASTTSGTTAMFDTVSVSTGGAVYELMIIGNPNVGGSSAYADVIYGKIIIGTGWNGAAVRNYIQFVCESPAPRSLYNSGGGPLTADAVYFQGGSEYTDIANGGTATIRIKIAGYNASFVGQNTTVRLKQLA